MNTPTVLTEPAATARLVVMAHAPLATALREVALHVYPDKGQYICAIDTPADEAPEATLQRALHALGASPSDSTSAKTAQWHVRGVVLVLCDLKGATPANVAQRLCEQLNAQSSAPRAHWLCGVNAPMLLRALCYWPDLGTTHDVDAKADAVARWAALALEGGQRGLEHATPQNIST